MAEQFCNQTLEGFLQLARYRETFFFSLWVSNFVFSLVTSLGNILVIRALLKASSMTANVKKLFLNLAFSDRGVGLVSQLMTGIIYAVILKRRLQLNVTLSNSYKFVVISLLSSLHCISPNSLHHCSRQTPRCFAPSAISRACHVQTCHYSVDIYMVNKFYHCLDIHFPSEKQ